MRKKVYDYHSKEDLEYWYSRVRTAREMADIFYCSEETIRKWLKRFGIPRHTAVNAGRKPTPLTINGISHTIREWSEITGVSQRTILDRKHKGYVGDELLWGRRRRG